MFKHLGCRSALISIVFSLCLASWSFAADVTRVEIPAGDLIVALQSLAKQTGIELVYQSETIKGVKTKGVSGTLSPVDALTKLLEGTGLKLNTDSTGAMLIAPAQAARGSSNRVAPLAVDDNSSTRLAQSNTSGQSQSIPETKEEEKKEGLSEIIVTGTHIRGATNETAPIQMITREDIEQSGYSTTQQLVASIPQNFSGGAAGASEDGQFGNGTARGQNASYATGLNLRGLGESSTLVLINGHRVAPSATGIFVDVSAIPISAIDRVEILTDGASAIYGADAVAGVVNFILRHDYSGQETHASYGAASGDTRREQVVSQAIGRDWSDGGGVLNVQYQKLGALSTADRAFSLSVPQPTYLLPESHLYSALLNVHQKLSSAFDVASDAFMTYQDRSELLTNPDRSNERDTPITREGTGNITFGYQPSNQWRTELSGSYSEENTVGRQLFTPLLPLNCGAAPCHGGEDFQLWSADAKTDGTLFQIPGGDVKGALGESFRHESFTVVNPFRTVAPFARHVSATFAELEIPIVGTENRLPLASSLGLSLAIRRDDYSDFGATTNPRFGVSWKPVESLHIRAAYSTSFRAPNAYEQTYGSLSSVQVYNDILPTPNGGTVAVLEPLNGRLAPLQPEKARNTSVGIDFNPPFARDFGLSIDYFNVLYRNRIIVPPYDAAALLKPSVYGSLFTPVANDAAAQAYVNAIEAQGGTFIDYTGMGITGVRYIYNLTQQNAARVRQNGVDVSVKYAHRIGANAFQAHLNGAYIHEISTALTDTSTAADTVNTYTNPLHWRGRADFAWSRNQWQLSSAINYSGRYVDTSTVPYVPISSWTTVDMHLEYKSSYFNGLSFGVSALNIFNRDPPSVVGFNPSTGVHYDTANASPLGRVLTLDARMAW